MISMVINFLIIVTIVAISLFIVLVRGQKCWKRENFIKNCLSEGYSTSALYHFCMYTIFANMSYKLCGSRSLQNVTENHRFQKNHVHFIYRIDNVNLRAIL